MSKALVLGGQTGLLGQSLVHILTENAWEVTTLGRQDGNLLDMDFLHEQITQKAPDVIFNTIAWTQVDDAEEHEDEALLWNRGLPQAIASIIKGTETLLVHYSTDFVFPGDTTRAYKEDDPTRPLSVYGSSKLAGEQALLGTIPDQCCILRTAWLFGPWRKNFITTILNLCSQRETINVVHDQTGCPTYTPDLARWSMLIAEKKATGIFHAANGGHASWCEFASEAASLAGKSCRVEPITSADWPQKATRPTYSVLDTSKLAACIGETPRPWPQALREYIFTYLPPSQE